MSKPPVGVVIVNHNLRDSLRETLASFRKVNYPGLQILVSDNASSDGSQDMVRKEFPKVRLLAHAVEQGYAGAATLGLAALADECTYLFSTTNDVTVDPEIISVLVNYAEAHPDTAVMGCKIFYFSRPDWLWHAGGRINPLHGHSSHYGWNRKDRPRYNRIRECDFLTGCGFLLRSDVLKKVGFHKTDLIFYSEDSDLCYRCKEAGYKVVYIPTAVMWHKTSTTLARNRPVQLHYSTRNALYVVQHHKVGFHPFTFWVFLFIVNPLKMAAFLLLGQWRNAGGVWRGIRDWRHGRFGWIKS
jgi:GT2 family glycosyltransferase